MPGRRRTPVMPIGTVIVFDASDETVTMIRTLMVEAGVGQSVVFCRSARDTDVRACLNQHRPHVVIVDLSLPYHGALFATIRDVLKKQGHGVVLTHTDRAAILAAFAAETRVARTALRTPSPAQALSPIVRHAQQRRPKS